MVPDNRFSVAPTVLNAKRSIFDRSSSHKTTFDAGKLVPLYVDEILPGDTVKCDASVLARMTTPIVPVMDDAFLDYYWFFVPTRQIWEHTKQFYGENDSTAWVSPTSYEVPQINLPTWYSGQYGASNTSPEGFGSGSLADYLGIPPRACSYKQNAGATPAYRSVNHLPFRAYVAIWNYFFRDQNLQNAAYNVTSDATVQGIRHSSTNDPLLYAYLGAELLPVDKYHDYFTSCTPLPQKGDPIIIPSTPGSFSLSTPVMDYGNRTDGGMQVSSTAAMYAKLSPTNTSDITKIKGIADISGALGSINDLRLAFQTQKALEVDLASGTRFNERIASHFGVQTGDARIQIPEYLGGGRTRVGMTQVVQTSSTDTTTPQGNTAAFSLTVTSDKNFTKSFVEPGYLMCVGCVRPIHTYSQGIERFWLKKDLYDFYDPIFANIGNQPVYEDELYLEPDGNMGATPMKSVVFGYQEAWADYRYKPNRLSGLQRPDVGFGATTLAYWNFGDNYATTPTLGDAWIRETDANMKRALAVQNQPMFIVDCHFKMEYSRVMPVYSVPGLVDHM